MVSSEPQYRHSYFQINIGLHIEFRKNSGIQNLIFVTEEQLEFMFGVWHYRICWYVKLRNTPNERSWREIPNECLSADCYCSVSSATKVCTASYNIGIELDNQAIQSAQLSVKTLIESTSFSLRRHHVKDRRIILSLLGYHRLYPMPLRSLSTSRAI